MIPKDHCSISFTLLPLLKSLLHSPAFYFSTLVSKADVNNKTAEFCVHYGLTSHSTPTLPLAQGVEGWPPSVRKPR